MENKMRPFFKVSAILEVQLDSQTFELRSGGCSCVLQEIPEILSLESEDVVRKLNLLIAAFANLQKDV